MKNPIIILLLSLCTFASYAQNEEVHISVAMPKNSILDNNAKTILKNKLLAICTTEGVAATECGAIVMIPEVSVLDEQLVEGGMHNIYIQELSITITVRNIITNTVFSTLEISCKGDGYSNSEAMRAAIKKINTTKYAEFAAATKQKIISYYSNNSSALLAKAKTLASQQQYGEALALLATYPESLSGYSQVSTAITQIYQQYLTQNCEEIMISAKAAYAKRDFDTAADLATSIDPSCSCFDSAKSLLALIKKDTDRMYNNEIAERRERRQAEERMTTATITAIKDVAVAYCKRKTNYIYFW